MLIELGDGLWGRIAGLGRDLFWKWLRGEGRGWWRVNEEGRGGWGVRVSEGEG